MQGGHQAQLGHRARWRRHAVEEPRGAAAVVDVLGRGAHQPHVERGAAGARERVGVPAEALGKLEVAGLRVAGAAIGKLRELVHPG